jgi:transposase-like protein
VGRRGYPPEFRRKVLDLIAGGKSAAETAAVLGISDQTIYSWRRQDRIDRGLEIWHNRQRRHSRLGMLTPIDFGGKTRPS